MRPVLSSGSGAAPASRRPSVTPEPAIRTMAEISPTRVAGAAQASASSGTASPAWVGRAPRAAHPSASAHPAGTSRSATHVSTSALEGSSPMAATTTAIDNGITSAHARVRNRSAHVGRPVAGTATQAACAETRTRLSTENHMRRPASSATRDALPAPAETTPQPAGALSRSGNVGVLEGIGRVGSPCPRALGLAPPVLCTRVALDGLLRVALARRERVELLLESAFVLGQVAQLPADREVLAVDAVAPLRFDRLGAWDRTCSDPGRRRRARASTDRMIVRPGCSLRLGDRRKG